MADAAELTTALRRVNPDWAPVTDDELAAIRASRADAPPMTELERRHLARVLHGAGFWHALKT